MANFPELTTIGQSSIESLIFDPVISTEFSSGHVATRMKFTGNLPKKLKITYSILPESDYTLVEVWKVSIRINKDSFEVVNPADNITWQVCLANELKWSINPGSPIFYNLECEFIGAPI